MHSICNLLGVNAKNELNKSETVHKICNMRHLTIEYEYIHLCDYSPFFSITRAHAQYTNAHAHIKSDKYAGFQCIFHHKMLSALSPIHNAVHKYTGNVIQPQFHVHSFFHSMVNFFAPCKYTRNVNI